MNRRNFLFQSLGWIITFFFGYKAGGYNELSANTDMDHSALNKVNEKLESINSSLEKSHMKRDVISVLEYEKAKIPVKGGADWQPAIQAANDAIVKSGKRGTLYFPAGTYKINSAVEIDVSYVSIDSPGATIDASAIKKGSALKLTSSRVQRIDQVLAEYKNIAVIGDTKEERGKKGTVGLELTGENFKGAANTKFYNIAIAHFDVGIVFKSHAYVVNFLGGGISKTNYCVDAPAGPVDAGERLTFIGSNFFNSNTLVRASNPNGALHFSTCSFDYPTVCFFEITGMRVFLTACHIEGSPDRFSSAPIAISGDGGAFIMHGGQLLFGSRKSIMPYVFDIQTIQESGGGVFLEGVFLFNLHTTSNYIATGPGNIKIKNSISFDQSSNSKMLSKAMNLLADGSFEKQQIVDNIFIHEDAKKPVDRLAGENGLLKLDTAHFKTGKKALNFTKKKGINQKCSFIFAVPIESGTHVFAEFHYKKPGRAYGKLVVTTHWVTLGTNTNGIPAVLNASNELSNDVLQFSAGEVDWTLMNVPASVPTRRPPAWATHFIIQFNANKFSEGFLFFDDFIITGM